MTVANTVKATAALATMGERDIRHRLHKDHQNFAKLTKTMAESDKVSERIQAFGQLKPSLTAHARTEEQIAYNGLIDAASDREADTLGREGYVEHHLADHLVERLSELEPATDDWIAHAKVLHEILTAHIHEEETDVFAQLGENFSREQLEDMGDRFERDKAAFDPSRSEKKPQPPKGSGRSERNA